MHSFFIFLLPNTSKKFIIDSSFEYYNLKIDYSQGTIACSSFFIIGNKVIFHLQVAKKRRGKVYDSLCRISTSVVCQLPKLKRRVRLPYPAFQKTSFTKAWLYVAMPFIICSIHYVTGK